MFRVFDHSHSVCYSAHHSARHPVHHSVYHLFCFLGLCCFLLLHKPTQAQNISAADSAESEKPYSNVYTKTSIKGRGFVPTNTAQKPLVDITYWPLTTSVGIASAVFLVPVGLAVGFLLHVSDSALNYAPTGAIGVSVTASLLISGTIGGLFLGTVADQIAHGTNNPAEPLPPMYPAYAASIGSGIFWGSILGLSMLVLAPNVGTGVLFLAGAPLGGYLASLLPVPETTAQVGLRNLGGAMGAVTVGSLYIPVLQLMQQTVEGSPSSIAAGTIVIAAGALPVLGLFVGDLIGQTNIYTDTDVFWVGVGAATGAAIGGGVTYTLSRIGDQSSYPFIATPIATNIGMYAGAGATLWGLASLHAAQAE